MCIGSETSRKLARKPEHFYIVEYVSPKYASKARPELGVKYLGLPDAVIPRCPADESLLAFVLTSKFAEPPSALPLGGDLRTLQDQDQPPDPLQLGPFSGFCSGPCLRCHESSGP